MLPVTEPLTLEQLALLPEREAVRAHFEARNCRALFRMMLLFVPLAMGIALVNAVMERYELLVAPIMNLVLIRLYFLLREKAIFNRRFRRFQMAFLIVQPLLWKAAIYDSDRTFDVIDFAAPLLLLFFRLPTLILALPVGVIWGLGTGRHIVESLFLADHQLQITWIVAQTSIIVVIFALADQLTRRQRYSFLLDWRREAHRYREQRRMQEELDDARKIQLSMLPKSEPRLPWLDISGISIPASEVGGDYYDYFTVSATRQVVVIGDVAGHGVASGLLLAGVRSCLHLLKASTLEPAQVLARIDRMLRDTNVSRSFVTLLYALFDHQEGTLTWASAGHPPILRRHSDGVVSELSIPALPLGTRLGGEMKQRRLEVVHNDIFVFLTDGLSETLNEHGEVYGDQRLATRLRAVSSEKSAREIRDQVLSEVWTYKADGQQLDDITVVVVKIREPTS